MKQRKPSQSYIERQIRSMGIRKAMAAGLIVQSMDDTSTIFAGDKLYSVTPAAAFYYSPSEVNRRGIKSRAEAKRQKKLDRNRVWKNDGDGKPVQVAA